MLRGIVNELKNVTPTPATSFWKHSEVVVVKSINASSAYEAQVVNLVDAAEGQLLLEMVDKCFLPIFNCIVTKGFFNHFNGLCAALRQQVSE